MPQLSADDRAIVKACFLEKGWLGTRICREFRDKKWNVRTVSRLIKKIKETGDVKRLKGSGRPATAVTEENEEMVESLILSQEDKPGTHDSQRKIARKVGVSRRSVQRIAKKIGVRNFKRYRSVNLPAGVRGRRLERSKKLLTRFPIRKVKLLTFQDEKDFTLEVPTNRQNNRVYSRNKKSEINESRLYHHGNKQSLKLMVSCCVSWNGVTPPFFVDPAKSKVTGELHTKHLRTQLIPACKKLYPQEDFIFLQDGAPSHTSNVCQSYLKDTLGRGMFVTKLEWPPKSPDLNVLDYYFWDRINTKVYEGRTEPFKDLAELRRRIKTCWTKVVNLAEIRRAIRQFRPRLAAVVKNNGGPIEAYYG